MIKKTKDDKIKELFDKMNYNQEQYKKELRKIINPHKNHKNNKIVDGILNDPLNYKAPNINENINYHLKEKLLNIFIGYIVCSEKGYQLDKVKEEVILDNKVHYIDLVFYNKKYNSYLLIKFVGSEINDKKRNNMFRYIDDFKETSNTNSNIIGMIVYVDKNNASIAYVGYDNLEMNQLFDKDELLPILKEIYDYNKK